jgi:16S rRNA (guanine(966)-N(2))-methyltransferase RsmD
VRPTPARVREALVNILSGRLEGAVVWDLFSGSGAFGIDCVSCGAERAVFVDASHINLKRINEFFRANDSESRCTTVKGKLPGVIERMIPPADIVFLDPPYRDTGIYSWIQEYRWDRVVRRGGIVVAESGGTEFDSTWGHRRYGDTHIHTLEVNE